jgi:hypothetical protein
MSVPLKDLGYETAAYVGATSHVSVPAIGSDTPSDQQDDYVLNGPAQAAVDVLATVQGPAASPWQRTDAGVDIDISNSPNVPIGMLRVSSMITTIVTGSDEGLAGVTRHSSVYGYDPPTLASAYIHGAVGVDVPPDGSPEDPVLFGVGVYDWGSGIDLLNWNLVVKDDDSGTIYLTANETDNLWSYTFSVPAGRVLDYQFSYYGAMTDALDGNYDLFVDLDFGAAYQTPEPASMLLLSVGALSLAMRKRRRRN